EDHYDALFNHLQQYERNTVNATTFQSIPTTTANSGNDPNVHCYNCNAKDAFEVEEHEELCTTVCMMAQIQQYEVNVNASKAKRVAKTHDPLALVENTFSRTLSSRSPPA
nr:hypothetical protein [Tanacetum cinerariifolium]